MLAPLLLLIAALVRADRGPALFVHRRIGLHGRSFGCLKFRTMACGSDRLLRELLERDPVARREWAGARKLRHDPRVTRLGRILRTTSLDELPQLVNVLRGEMSLVGPRPVVESELAAFYGSAARHYVAVRPGITGLWQVSGRSDTDYGHRVLLDTAYVQELSLRRDLRILLRTVAVVLRTRGAR